DDVVDLQLQQELDFAFVLSARTFLTGAALARWALQNVARLGFALSRALLVFGAAQAEVIVLEHAHRYAHGLRTVVDDIGAGNDLRQVLAHRVADFLVVAKPVTCTAREQLVPLRQPERTATAAFGHWSLSPLRRDTTPVRGAWSHSSMPPWHCVRRIHT